MDKEGKGAGRRGNSGRQEERWRQRKKPAPLHSAVLALLMLILQMVAATGAGAEPGAGLVAGTGGAGLVPQSKGMSVAGKADPAGEGQTGGEASGPSVSASACLKEGEACNPLNDLCCPGYYCPGGLARTCAPKP